MKATLKIATMVLALVLSIQLSAQDINKKAMQKIDEQVKEMVDVMGLDKKQEAKVLEIKKQQHIDRKALTEKYDKESKEFVEKVKELNKLTNQKIKAVCTKEQWKKWSSRNKD